MPELFVLNAVPVTVTMIPIGDSSANFKITWSADGKFLWWDRTFGTYEKVLEVEDLYFMRDFQCVDALGLEFETPKGKCYIGPVQGKQLMRVQDTEGNVRDFPFEFEEGNVFHIVFTENDILGAEYE